MATMYARITLDEKGARPLYLRITSETDVILTGVEVNKDGDDIIPKGFDQRVRIISKTIIKKRVPYVMDNHYAMLVPAAPKGETRS